MNTGRYVPGSGRQKTGWEGREVIAHFCLFFVSFFHMVSALLYTTWLKATHLSYGRGNIYVQLFAIDEQSGEMC